MLTNHKPQINFTDATFVIRYSMIKTHNLITLKFFTNNNFHLVMIVVYAD
jgi:hypothetical protein